MRGIGSGLAAGVASAAVRGGSTRNQLGNIANDVIATTIGNTVADSMANSSLPNQGKGGVTGQFGDLLDIDTAREAQAMQSTGTGSHVSFTYPDDRSGSAFVTAGSVAEVTDGVSGKTLLVSSDGSVRTRSSTDGEIEPVALNTSKEKSLTSPGEFERFLADWYSDRATMLIRTQQMMGATPSHRGMSRGAMWFGGTVLNVENLFVDGRQRPVGMDQLWVALVLGIITFCHRYCL